MSVETGADPARSPRRSARLATMARRADFLAANRGIRVARPGFVLLVNPLSRADGSLRFGVTVTKKIGNAVARNRMKRRFRALLRELLPAHGIAGAAHRLLGPAKGVARAFCPQMCFSLRPRAFRTPSFFLIVPVACVIN